MFGKRSLWLLVALGAHLDLSKALSTKKNDFSLQRIWASTFLLCGCLSVLPLPTDATEYQQRQQLECPQFFASQNLGIQNVVFRGAKTTPFPLKRKPTKTVGFCKTTDEENPELTIQGMIYLPSRNDKQGISSSTFSKDDELIIEISNSDKPAAVLAGARIPMSQIPNFPISFRLSKANLLLDTPESLSQEQVWNGKIFYGPSDLYVNAKIITKNTADVFHSYQGRGVSKLLMLPGTSDDEFRFFRAAASIRLTQASTPDILFTW